MPLCATPRMYDTKNHVGRYTEEEVEQLRNLRAIHGNRWGTIGALMGRSAASVKDRVRVLRDNCNQGQSTAPGKRALETRRRGEGRYPGEVSKKSFRIWG